MPEHKLFIVPRDQARRQRVPNNLPTQSTPLIGREAEVVAARSLLSQADVHLLTLMGPGGVGKTRLALRVAEEALEEFEDGVYLVELAPITDPDLVIPTIASTLGVREVPGSTLLTTLKEHLRGKRTLLVLDNFEQVVPAGAVVAAVAELLATCPDLKVVVTSRDLLHLYGEYNYPVPPLSLPTPGSPLDLEVLSRYEAVALFVQRAQAVSSGFELTDHNAHAVAEICLRLDGLPLAIELAAARILVLPPEELLARLNSRLKLLTGGARNLPERQRTLQAAIDWSYNLLNAGEQTLFRRLGVFVGGCSLEAIEQVCGSVDLVIDTLDGVPSLVGKSLLQRQEGVAGKSRFVMLETIREYALEKLEESGEGDTVRRHHASFFVAFVERAAPELWGGGRKQIEWLNQLEQELDNLRAVMGWSLAHGSVETAARVATPLARFWFIHGRSSEGRGWLEGVLDARHLLATSILTKVLGAAGTMVGEQGDYERANKLLSEYLSLCRQSGDQVEVALALNRLGLAASIHGDEERAIALWEESLALRRQLQDKWGVAQSLMNIGESLNIKGDYVRAEAMLEESRTLWEELGDEIGKGQTLHNMADTALRCSEYAKAEALAKQALLLFRSLGSEVHTIRALDLLAYAWAEQGNAVGAVRLLAAVEALSEARQQLLSNVTATLPEHSRNVSAARTQVDEESFARLWAEGRAMSPEQAIAYALEPSVDERRAPANRRPPSVIVGPSSSERQQPYPDELIEREVEVLRLIAAGKSNHEIASELVLSRRTAERHISNIYQKIGATGKVARATATAYALRHGLAM